MQIACHCKQPNQKGSQNSNTFSPNDRQGEQTSDDFFHPNSYDDNTAVNLKAKHLQTMDRNMNQKQENMKEFAANMMQQRQITDFQSTSSNVMPKFQNERLPGPQNPQQQGANNCLTNKDELDKCSAQLIAFGSSKATYPHDMDELNNVYCPRVKKLLTCIKNSSTCFSRFDRQVIE